jgi:hypothetical protein
MALTQGQRDGLDNARRNAAQWQEMAESFGARGLEHDAARAATIADDYRNVVARIVNQYGEV